MKIAQWVYLPLCLLMTYIGQPLMAAEMETIHRVVLHLDDNDPQRMNLVLNNATNINNFYQEKGEEVEVEIVTYGPGLHMLRADTSPVSQRVTSFEQNYTNITFRACSNTLTKMTNKEGKAIALLSQAKLVPSGIIHLIQRQEEGWIYVRP